MYKWFIPGCIRQVERTPKGKHGKCQRCIFILSPSTAFDFTFYSRSKQTVTTETREGATYSESVTLADYEDIEEIPPPKYIPNFKPMPNDNRNILRLRDDGIRYNLILSINPCFKYKPLSINPCLIFAYLYLFYHNKHF